MPVPAHRFRPRARRAKAAGVVAAAALVAACSLPGGSAPPPARTAAPLTSAAGALHTGRAPAVTVRPSASVAALGARVAARGRVPAGGRSVVVLQRRDGGAWATLGRTTPSAAGEFALPVPTARAGVHTFRVVSGRTPSAAFSVGVGAGDPRSVAYLTTPPARWNACRPIRYRVNSATAPAGAAADLDRAIAQVTQASGLRFVRVGTTAIVPGASGKDAPDAYPAGTDLVVAWTRPAATRYLAGPGRTLGVGGAFYERATRTTGGRAWHRIVQGYLVLDGTHRLPGGFGPGHTYGELGTWGQVLMHELGHVVGLGHPKIADPRQIMYPETSHKPAVWGAGDLVGLHALGAAAGCL